VVAAKKLADANRTIQDFGIDDIQVLNGRYGPYITDKNRNARIPKDRDPKTLTLDECRTLLAAAPQRPGRGRFRKAGAKAKAATPAKQGAAATEPAATATKPSAKKSAAKKTAATGKSATAGKPATAKKPRAAKKPPRGAPPG
jgi:DNA topoisomerase-1